MLIYGSLLCALFIFFFGLSYGHSISSEMTFLFLYIAAFSFSQGPIWYRNSLLIHSWVYISETLSHKRIGYANLASWSATLVVSLATPPLLRRMGSWLFYLYAALTLLV